MLKNRHFLLITLLIIASLLTGSCRASKATKAHHPPTTGATVSELRAKLAGLDIDEFFEVSFLELTLRDPELILELGLEEALGIETVQLTDISNAYIRETHALESAILEMLREYDREALSDEQKIAYDVYETYLADKVHGHEFIYYNYLVTHYSNSVTFQTEQFFTDIHPLTDKEDAQDYITRLGLVKPKYDQAIEGLRLREGAGVIPPRFFIRLALDQAGIRRIAGNQPQETPFYTVFKDKVSAINNLSEAEKEALLRAAEKAITTSVIPAYQALQTTMEELEEKAPVDEGVWQFENGDAYYSYLLRHYTTTDLSADEIHHLGLQEVERVRAEMDAIFDQLGYPQGESLPALFERVAEDGGIVPAEQMVAVYDKIIAKARIASTAISDLQPQADVIVIGGQIGGFYVPGALDGSRPGAFYASTTIDEPYFGMPSLAYHEAIPGHHFQIAIAQELDLPSIRKHLRFTAYSEGWALYAERLAAELGWYADDPFGDLGRLQYEAWRAVRLVVDTGIHAKHWTFDQAVDYMIANTGLDRNTVLEQISRYIVWPGQSTAYMIGMLKILELRQYAMEQLGQDFDLKEFHNLVLGNGNMPLDVLEEVVKGWVEGK